MEKKFFDKFGFENLLNLYPDPRSCLGYKHSNETREKFSKAASIRLKGNTMRRGKKESINTKLLKSAAMVGNKCALGHTQSQSAKKIKSIKSKASWKQRRESDTDGFKLSRAQVEAIRREYKRTSYLVSNRRELAAKYKVSDTQILRVASGGQRA